MLKKINVPGFRNSEGTIQDIHFTYQTFGPELGKAPVVLVLHALSGNSEVIGPKGWWNELIGIDKPIDSQNYTILAIDMPGNGFNGKKEHLLRNYKEFTLRDFAKIYLEALRQLNISEVFAGIGGSIGGALLWETAVLAPDLFQNIVPVATDYKTTQWLKALCKVQDQILNNSEEPLKDARMHAMTFYRSPESFKEKFSNSERHRGVETWLEHHGSKLEQRFQLASYKLMNHLLSTIDISNGDGNYLQAAEKIKSNIHIVTVNSDRFFIAEENWETYVNLSLIKTNIQIHEIKSIHGHDAFLIENGQLSEFLSPIFTTNKNKNEKDKYSSLWGR